MKKLFKEKLWKKAKKKNIRREFIIIKRPEMFLRVLANLLLKSKKRLGFKIINI